MSTVVDSMYWMLSTLAVSTRSQTLVSRPSNSSGLSPVYVQSTATTGILILGKIRIWRDVRKCLIASQMSADARQPSIGRRRFVSLRSLRGLLPLAKCLTTIRWFVPDSYKKVVVDDKNLSSAACRFSAYSPHARLTVGAINSLTFVLKDIRKMNRYSGAVKCFAASC